MLAWEYINSGDTYEITLIYNWNTGLFTIGDIGTIRENNEVENE
jgi:hypothetical protein